MREKWHHRTDGPCKRSQNGLTAKATWHYSTENCRVSCGVFDKLWGPQCFFYVEWRGMNRAVRVLFLSLLAAVAAFGQRDLSTLAGSVTDTTGGVVVNA